MQNQVSLVTLNDLAQQVDNSNNNNRVQQRHKDVATSMKGDFPKAGIKVKFLLDEFLKAAKTIGDIDDDDLTTGEVRVQFIMPLTSKKKSSYCQMLKVQEHWAYAEEPDAFISHAHGHKFKEFLSALEWKFHQEPEASVWLDLFSINQHEPMDWTFDWLSTTFRSNVAGIGRTVMVMSPWNNPYPYSRTWCIFEAFATVAEGGQFEIALSKTDEHMFLKEIKVDAYQKMNEMVATIRAENSECSVENDRISIYKIIHDTIGFAKLDMMLFQCYRKWVIDVAVSALDSCLDKEQQLDLYFSIFGLYYQQGNLRQAEYYAKKGLDASKAVHGEDHLSTVAAMINLAIALKYQGRYDQAVIMYQQCLEKSKATLGEDDPMTLGVMNNLAKVFQCQGQYDKSIESYQLCLEKQKALLGEDHPDTLLTMGNVANILGCQRRYDEAIALLQPCLDRQKVVLGEDHPDTLNTMGNMAYTMRNLADAFDSTGQYNEAIKLYQSCLDKQKVVFGEDHPNTLHTTNNLAVALEKKGRCDEAVELHQECWNRRKGVLGEDYPDTLQSMNGLAYALQKQGQLDKAVQLSHRCLEKQTICLGMDHLDTLNTMDTLACSLEKQGKLKEAVNLFETCLGKLEETVGKDHPLTVEVRGNLRRATERNVSKATS